MTDVEAEISRVIGREIARARHARTTGQGRGWSQAKLAFMLNQAVEFRFTTTANYVSKWERGVKRPGYEWGPVIERVLDLDLAAIETAARADLTPAPGGAGPEAAMPAAEVTDRAEGGTLTGAPPARFRVAPPPP